jgi:acyl transferase domain-containing protein/NADPH:quinone reductase-like Zn-dependent oxidoreductase/acyl carrier protein
MLCLGSVIVGFLAFNISNLLLNWGMVVMVRTRQGASFNSHQNGGLVRPEPIAIVGIGCRFPANAVDPDSLWHLLINGVDAVGDVPADRWDARRFYHPDGSVPGKTYARHGGFLTQSPFEFDAHFFGLSAREAAILDPQQRLLLEATWEAFEDAGHDCLQLHGRKIGVFVGGFNLDNLVDRLGVAGRDHISPNTATSATMVMLSNRISHAFDFIGPSVSVDTACSSSLVATHLACTSLWRGESEMAIAAGANVMLAPEPFIAMSKGGFLSRQGRCKAFDESADGYVRAEGVGVVVLKPLAVALTEGDRIYATILASGVNQDGHTPGISMPNARSQQALIRQVLGDSQLSPRDIVYVEAHGTGTQAGDPIEANSLGAEIGAGRAQEAALWVGSIKTNIGHTEAAAGVAGLIKAALILHHRVVPPNLHFHSANPKINLPALGLRIPVKAEPLAAIGPLCAAVNSFGYGGTNAHVVLATPPENPLSLEEALRLTYHRGEAFQRLLGKGSMMAIGLGLDAVTKVLQDRAGDISVTAILAPDSVVVGGAPVALNKLASDLSNSGVFNRRLHVDVAYHHAQVDLIEDDLRNRFGAVAHEAPQLPLYSTLLGGRVDDACHDADYWCRGSRAPADFAAAMLAAMRDGFDAVLELGPNRVMSAAVKSTASLVGQSVWTGASLVRGEAEALQIQRTLADMYVHGVPVDWHTHHPGGRFTRYPRYPWQRERLWLEAPETHAGRALLAEETWLQERVDGPGATWITDLSSPFFDYLRDHVVGDAAILPAAGYIAALLAGSRAINRGNSLEWLRLERPLPLAQGVSIRIDIDEGTGAATIYGRPDQSGAWHRYASGRVGFARAPMRSRIDIDQRKQATSEHLAAVDLYAMLAEHGLTYGPAFRAIREVWFGPDEVVAATSLPGELAPERPIHPVLVDAAFQALAAIFLGKERSGPFIPAGVREVRLHGAVTGTAWTIARIIERNENSFSASVWLCDTVGTVVVEVDGLRCQRLPIADPDRLGQAFFEDSWERTSLPSLRRTTVESWVVLGDKDNLVSRLLEEIRHHGHNCRWLGDAETTELASGRLRPDGIVWIAPAVDRGDAGLFATNQLVALIQQISRSQQSPSVVIVTRGATGETPRPDHAAVWGLGRVTAAEHAEVPIALVDCEDDERVPLWLAREILGDTLEREVRLGSAGRLVCRLQSWSGPEPKTEMVNTTEVPVALRQTRAGMLDSLTWHEIGRRDPGPGEMEIRSVAAALNFKDVLKSMSLLPEAYVENTFFGGSLGMETAGVVTRVGDGVERYSPGDEVVAVAPHFASYLVVDASLARRKPAGLSFAQTPVFINYMTAYHGLVDVARLQRGESVLIHLGSGGVGQAAIAVARMIGAEIFATAGDPDKRAHLRSQGIEHVFDSRSIDFADAIVDITRGVGVDVVLNSLAGEALRRSWDILAPYGRFIEIGKRDIEENAMLSMRGFDENRTFASIDLDRILRERPALLQRIWSDVERLFADGRIGPLPTQAFAASRVSEAFRVMSRARHVGKIVVDFEGDAVLARRLPPPAFRRDRTYLVTGAFGGFGTALVRWMAQEGARYFVLVGRNGASTDEAGALVEELRGRQLSIAPCALDVGEKKAVEALIGDIRAGGPPLGGIFHAAMVVDDTLLLALDPERLEAVMRPKALGAWHLHRATKDDPLQHFVLFSSVAQTIGNVGQGAYCAANGFLDGLARHRHTMGLPALSVAWGVLGDAGIAARSPPLLKQLEKLGLRTFTTSQALNALGRLLRSAPPCVAFADVDWVRWASQAKLAETPRFKNIVQSSGSNDRIATFRRELLAQPASQRLGILYGRLTAALSPVLGLPASRIPLDRALDKLGVDSLMAVELSLAFERDAGLKLPTSLLMQGPTISEIAAHVLTNVLAVENLEEGAVDALSEAETDELLALLAERGELDLAGIS